MKRELAVVFFSTLNPRHHSQWMNKHFFIVTRWVTSCSVGGIYDVWTSEKTIIRHNIESQLAPACMQTRRLLQTTEYRHWWSHLISLCTHTNTHNHTHTLEELWHIFLPFKVKQSSYSVCIVFWASNSCFLHLAGSTIRPSFSHILPVFHQMYSTLLNIDDTRYVFVISNPLTSHPFGRCLPKWDKLTYFLSLLDTCDEMNIRLITLRQHICKVK